LTATAARHPEIAERLREARALDAVLAQAPAVPADQMARARQRILEAAGGNRPAAAVQSSTGTVIPLPRRALSDRTRLHQFWPAAAALAASLLIGVLLGTSELGRPAVESLVASAGLDVGDGGTFDLLDATDEELL
jgi:hypothetical protein